jgi:hypothetical protein
MSASEQNDPTSHIANIQAQLESLQASLESAARQVARVCELLNTGSAELPPSSDHEAYESPATLIRPPAPSPTPPLPPEEEDYSRRIDNNEVLKGVDERLRGLAG